MFDLKLRPYAKDQFFNYHIDLPSENGQSKPSGKQMLLNRNSASTRLTVSTVWTMFYPVIMQRLEFYTFNGLSPVKRIFNWFSSLLSYADLRPDMGLRRQINRQVLADRPQRSLSEWYRLFWEPQGVSREVADFVYGAIANYAGLKVAQVLPSDRLYEDLKLPLICWFDWELNLCEEFSHKLGVELEEYFDVTRFATVADLVQFFDQQFAAQAA
jgi:hypothetical protein